jgi:hypothetical protein
MQCSARAKSSGQQCRRRAVTGMRVCQVHGGVTPKGPASPHWIDGRHSKYLPKHLLGAYLAARDDPERLALMDELALIDARLNDVLGRVDSGESGRLWTELRKTVAALEAAKRSGDVAVVATTLTTIVDLVTQGHDDAAAWQDVAGLIERRRKLVDSESKRQREAREMIHIEQAFGLMGMLVEAVRGHVTDPTALRAVAETFSRLTGQPIPTEAPPLPAGMKGQARWNA